MSGDRSKPHLYKRWGVWMAVHARTRLSNKFPVLMNHGHETIFQAYNAYPRS